MSGCTNIARNNNNNNNKQGRPDTTLLLYQITRVPCARSRFAERGGSSPSRRWSTGTRTRLYTCGCRCPAVGGRKGEALVKGAVCSSHPRLRVWSSHRSFREDCVWLSVSGGGSSVKGGMLVRPGPSERLAGRSCIETKESVHLEPKGKRVGRPTDEAKTLPPSTVKK